MTIVADDDVLTAAEFDFVVDELVYADLPVNTDTPPASEPVTEPVFLRVEKGNPTDAELAALVCVLSAAAQAPVDTTPAPRDRWGQPTLLHRGTSPFSPYSYPQLSQLRG